MGQTIEINNTRQIGNVLIISADRSLTGQEGEAYTPGYTTDSDTFPARLAEKLFAVDRDIDRVHVLSNSVTVSRASEWTSEAVESVTGIVSSFFRYYPD